MPASPQHRLAAIRHWAATADEPPARWLRRALRGTLRLRARLVAGSVSAYMDAVVTEANSASVGSGLSPELHSRRRLRTRRHRSRRPTGDTP